MPAMQTTRDAAAGARACVTALCLRGLGVRGRGGARPQAHCHIHGVPGRDSKMSKPRVLVLDCGSITNPDCEAGNLAVAAAMGVAPDDARKAHKEAWARARSDPQFTSYWQTAFAAAGVPEVERTAAREQACESALAAALRTTYPASLDAARRAKAAGLRVGIISNHLVSPNLFAYCAEGAGLYDLATDASLVVVSQAVGLGKPNPEIYKLFFERLLLLDENVTPGELVFVDDKQKNVDAARALGWQGIVHDAKSASPNALAEELVALGVPLA